VAENLGELEAAVREAGADVGFATDPDADRLSLVSDAGRAIGEDFTLALAAQLVLRHRPGPVVTNLSTSRVLEDVTAAAGVPSAHAGRGRDQHGRAMGKPAQWSAVRVTAASSLPDVHLTRDAAVAVALVLQLMLERGRSVEQLVAEQTPYTIVKDKLPRDAGSLAEAYDTLEQGLGAPLADRQDGLRLDWPEERRWLHLRASGTEPILRIIAEAPSAGEARALVASAREALGLAPVA
jgi:phosphomannomutase